MYSLSYIK